jgi:hypothetical protein
MIYGHSELRAKLRFGVTRRIRYRPPAVVLAALEEVPLRLASPSARKKGG